MRLPTMRPVIRLMPKSSLSGQSSSHLGQFDHRCQGLAKSGGTDRIASTWFSATSFDIDINLTDGNWHQIAFYCLDWDSNDTRIQTVEVLDAVSGTVLDSRSLSDFSNGRYLIWNLAGHVKIRATKLGPTMRSSTGSSLICRRRQTSAWLLRFSGNASSWKQCDLQLDRNAISGLQRGREFPSQWAARGSNCQSSMPFGGGDRDFRR